MLEVVPVLFDADKLALQRNRLKIRSGAPQQMFSTGLFKVSIPRSG